MRGSPVSRSLLACIAAVGDPLNHASSAASLFVRLPGFAESMTVRRYIRSPGWSVRFDKILQEGI